MKKYLLQNFPLTPLFMKCKQHPWFLLEFGLVIHCIDSHFRTLTRNWQLVSQCIATNCLSNIPILILFDLLSLYTPLQIFTFHRHTSNIYNFQNFRRTFQIDELDVSQAIPNGPSNWNKLLLEFRNWSTNSDTMKSCARAQYHHSHTIHFIYIAEHVCVRLYVYGLECIGRVLVMAGTRYTYNGNSFSMYKREQRYYIWKICYRTAHINGGGVL